jgi:hypothetical protein
MEGLPAGLWCDLVLSCLPVSEVLCFRLCSRGTNLLVTQQVQLLTTVLTQRQAAYLQDPDMLRIKEGLKLLCQSLISQKVSLNQIIEMTKYMMMPPIFSDLRFVFMNIIQQTHNPSHLVQFSEELNKQDFSCLQNKQALGKTLKRIGDYLAGYSRAQVVTASLDGRLYDFIEGFADLTIGVPDNYYFKRSEVQRLERDKNILQHLASRIA